MADLFTFLREALRPLFSRRMLVPALLLTLLLTASNIVIVRAAPVAEGEALSGQFLAAALVRVCGMLVFIIGIVRILAASPRRPWLPDGAFWLSVIASILLFAVSALVGLAVDGEDGMLNAVLANVLTILVVAPFEPWLVALAAEKPLALRPAPWLRNVRAWLPHLVFWTLLLVLPLGLVHGEIDRAVLDGVDDDLFWQAMLVDGPLSAVILLLALGLNNAAYRRVARG